MRAIPLADQSDGINLLRSKGGASPSGLFDLVNGWVTPKRTINARPGSVRKLTFPAGTSGVIGFEGKFHTFAAAPVTTGGIDPLVVVHVLRRSDGATAAISKIHRAFPFLGRLYVVAEFADGAIRHFWIEQPVVWTAGTVYSYGQKVMASVDSGFYFVIEDTVSFPAWQANTKVSLNDVKQPTVANGFSYKLTAVVGGTNYLTSNTEPTWPTTDGATVTERRYITVPQVLPGSGTPAPGTVGGSSASTEYGTSGTGSIDQRQTKVL